MTEAQGGDILWLLFWIAAMSTVTFLGVIIGLYHLNRRVEALRRAIFDKREG